jgi:hypothetical protein
MSTGIPYVDELNAQLDANTVKEETTPLLPEWRDQFTEREQKEIKLAEVYYEQFSHGTTGHNQLIIIARMSHLLDGKDADPEPQPQRIF